MNKTFKQLFKDSMVGAVSLITLVMLTGLLFLVPYLSQEQAKKDAFAESERLIAYIKMFRSYYAKNILNKINLHTDLYANFDHKTQDKVVPLPATLVHDLGALFTNRTDTRVEMYSNYPFPNRADRKLDSFQQEALAFVLKNPQKVFSKEDTINGKKVFRTAMPDYLSAESCVSCHNFRPDTPKNDWKLGDVRGVIEVAVPLETSLGSAKTLTYSIVAFILFNFSILGIYYFFYMRKKNKKLQDTVLNKDKLLSEYKRAVDLGAIVSKADTDGLITYANDAFVKISGYSKDELIGKPHSIVRHPESQKNIFQEMWEKISNKEVWQGDIKNLTKHGETYYVHATIVPILDEHNEIVEYLAIRYETTSLHKAIQKANDAEKTKGRFLANMSHELRTPLNAIIGFSQILQRKKTMNEKDLSYVEKIGISGQNLLTLVNSILDFSKIEEGAMECHPSEVNIKTLFEEVLIMFETSLSEKNISLTMFKCNGEKTLLVDRQLIKQSLINIISNAVKFTQENGEIKLTYREAENKHIFGVCDNGVGISRKDIKTLFEPFKQGESAQKSAAKGTGLGLAITKKIITQLHDGDIWVESELEKGSCFYISL